MGDDDHMRHTGERKSPQRLGHPPRPGGSQELKRRRRRRRRLPH